MKSVCRHQLQPTEYTFLTVSVAGAIAAAITQQIVYATLPLTLALSLNISNRQRFQQQNQYTKHAIADVHQVKQDIEAIKQEVNTLSQAFNARLELKEIDGLKAAFTQVSQTNEITEIQSKLQLLQEKVDQCNQHDETLDQAVNQLQLRLQIIRTLCSEINGLKRQQRVLNQICSQLQDTNQQGYVQLEQKIESLNQQNETLIQENSRLIETLSKENQQHNYLLSEFERAILSHLQNNLDSQRIIPQFDAGIGGDKSKSTDFLIVMDNCIIAIEAKAYQGLIESIGEPRNTKWTCKTKSGRIPITACWSENPYKQVRTYVDGIRNCLKTRSKNKFLKIPVYGIVVFPTGAKISSSIECNIGESYRVTTVNDLLKIVYSLETAAKTQNKSGISSNKILDILLSSSKQI